MSPIHIVQQGEHLSSIAEQYGLADYRILWNHPQNRQLREQRGNPNVLYPGDEVYIPERADKEQDCQTERRHTFEKAQRIPKLRLVLKDFTDRPLSNLKCELQVEGETYDLTTNQDGMIEHVVPPSAKDGLLTARNVRGEVVMQMPLKIGDLDPVEEQTGWQARLKNLGYDAGLGGEGGPEILRAAVEEFQRDQRLQVDGNCGPQTQAKLKQVHGC